MKAFKVLLKYLRPYRIWAILAPLLMLLEVVMDLMQPRMIQRIVDEGLARLDMNIVITTGLAMIGFALLGAVGGIGCTVFSTLASLGFGADLREALFRKVHSLSFGNFDELETGQLVTRLTNDVVQVEGLVSMMLRVMVRAPLLLLGSLVMVFLTSPRLALLVVALGPLVIGMLVWVIKKAYPLFGEVQRRLDKLNTVMEENLAGVRVVKAFVRADHEIKRFGRSNDALMEQTIRAARTVAISWPFMSIAVNLGVIGALWFGGRMVMAGDMHIGQLIAFYNYLMRTLMSLMFVSMLIMQWARAQASAERIMEVLQSVPVVQNKPTAMVDFAPRGRVVFENVAFSYEPEGHDLVLGGSTGNNGGPPGISFVAEPGQIVAILGATGAGKSSLIHLIPRFYDVTRGRVTIDGLDVRDIDQATLRRHIGMALQESVLFSGTIRDNICYGRPDATEEEMIAAAKAAQAHDFIVEFPDGYDTVVGQRGVNLSGGQKQRIAIARALLVNPAVLILDDSTSSVDVETETKIQAALEDRMRERTGFIVAQRISTVLNADKILVLDDGCVVAEGTHRELLASSPVYREIYESQLGNGVNHG